MTDDVEKVDPAPADVINDFWAIHPRQISGPEWAVLSFRGDEPTAYTVDLRELDCDCPDMQKNKGDPEICDHLAKALYKDKVRKDVPETAEYHLSAIVDRAASAAREIEDMRDQVETARSADAAHAAAEAASDDGETASDDPISLLERALEDVGVDPDGVDAWIDDQYSSLQFKADGMDDDDFDLFRDWCQDVDQINWDRNERRNYIKQDDIGRVLG